MSIPLVVQRQSVNDDATSVAFSERTKHLQILGSVRQMNVKGH